MSLTIMGQQFIEDSIEYIDEGAWYKFFKYLLMSKCDFEDAHSIIETLVLSEINFDEKARREIFETQIRNRIAFWKAKGEFQIELTYFYGHENNWLGYSISDVEKYLDDNAGRLVIQIRKWSSSPQDTQIIFEF